MHCHRRDQCYACHVLCKCSELSVNKESTCLKGYRDVYVIEIWCVIDNGNLRVEKCYTSHNLWYVQGFSSGAT
jgi:hypothetical protein